MTKLQLFLVSNLFLLSLPSFSFDITEDTLLKLANKANPSLAEIESSFLTSKVQSMELDDKFGFEAYGGHNNIQTKEKSTISFQPVFKSVNQYTLGVKKYTKYGMVLDLNTSVDTRSGQSESGSDYKDLHTTVYEFGIQMDLWKDFLGRITKNQTENLQDIKAKDELQKEISISTFKVNVRKLYWAIMANHQKIEVMNKLYETAKVQAAEARKRKASSISDKAEVARFESFVHQRKGQILALEYEREALFKNLRELFPNLNNEPLKVANIKLDKSIFEVVSCSTQIGKTTEVPYDSTKYDEVVNLLNGIKERQLKVDNTYDDIDLKFDLKLKKTGVSSSTTDNSNYTGDYQDSLDDMNDNDRSGLNAGIMLTIPFGEDKSSTKTVKEELTNKQFEASIDSLNAKVRATHSQIKNSIHLLNQVISEQRENSKQLGIRVKEMKKKYAQARIPEYVLLQDQDALLQSDLNVIDTQLMIVNTILDYISVFNEYPCSFNRK